MTNKELEETLNSYTKKVDKLSDLEDRLEKAWKNVEKYRNSMIDKGFSYPMIEEFNKAIQPVQQYVNTIRNVRAKEDRIRQGIEERKRAQALREEKEFPFNTKCRNFYLLDGEAKCEVGMDTCFCSVNCPYCTNRVGSYVTNKSGVVVGRRKYSIGGRL